MIKKLQISISTPSQELNEIFIKKINELIDKQNELLTIDTATPTVYNKNI